MFLSGKKLCGYRKVSLVNQTWPRKWEGFYPTDTFLFHKVAESEDPAVKWVFQCKSWMYCQRRLGEMWNQKRRDVVQGLSATKRAMRGCPERDPSRGLCEILPLVKRAEKGMAKGDASEGSDPVAESQHASDSAFCASYPLLFWTVTSHAPPTNLWRKMEEQNDLFRVWYWVELH